MAESSRSELAARFIKAATQELNESNGNRTIAIRNIQALIPRDILTENVRAAIAAAVDLVIQDRSKKIRKRQGH